MGKAPAFQFYAGDRAMELMGLDNEAAGAWIRAVMFLWTSGPSPEERLSNVAGKGWERVRFLFTQFDGGISLDWMEESREKQRVFREEAAIHGAKGGRPPKAQKGSLRVSKPNPNQTQRVGSMKNEVEREEEGKERAHEPEIIPAGVSKELFDALKAWEQYRVERKSKLTPSGKKALIKKCLDMGAARSIAAIEHSMANGWAGLFEPKNDTNTSHKNLSDDEYARQVAEAANRRFGTIRS